MCGCCFLEDEEEGRMGVEVQVDGWGRVCDSQSSCCDASMRAARTPTRPRTHIQSSRKPPPPPRARQAARTREEEHVLGLLESLRVGQVRRIERHLLSVCVHTHICVDQQQQQAVGSQFVPSFMHHIYTASTSTRKRKTTHLDLGPGVGPAHARGARAKAVAPEVGAAGVLGKHVAHPILRAGWW